jgi:WD40 repeat protein
MSDDVLVSGSWDSTLKVWKVLPSGIDKPAIADFVDNDSEINCVAIHSHLIAAGAADGACLIPRVCGVWCVCVERRYCRRRSFRLLCRNGDAVGL